MKAREITELLKGKVLSCERLIDKVEIERGFAADLMSDVLALLECENRDVVLITGITNPQIVRTAEMLDIPVIIVTRGKKVPEETINLSEKIGIILISTEKITFETSGILYSKGIKGAKISGKRDTLK